MLNRFVSTIKREVRRNGGSKFYRASQLNAAAWKRSHRPTLCKLAGNDYLCRAMSAKLSAAARQLNGRSRKTLEYETPA
jgi:IS30 family transposase